MRALEKNDFAVEGRLRALASPQHRDDRLKDLNGALYVRIGMGQRRVKLLGPALQDAVLQQPPVKSGVHLRVRGQA